MEISVLIDKITDCLVRVSDGKVCNTSFYEKTSRFHPSDYKGWKFNWQQTQKDGFTVYELMVDGDPLVQGRISLRLEGGVANVDIVETAPHNYGHDGKYEGVGGHLFAIACKLSKEAGFDGVVCFTSKYDLIEYYTEHMKATLLYGQRMAIYEDAAQWLIEKYFGK